MIYIIYVYIIVVIYKSNNIFMIPVTVLYDFQKIRFNPNIFQISKNSFQKLRKQTKYVLLVYLKYVMASCDRDFIRVELNII